MRVFLSGRIAATLLLLACGGCGGGPAFVGGEWRCTDPSSLGGHMLLTFHDDKSLTGALVMGGGANEMKMGVRGNWSQPDASHLTWTFLEGNAISGRLNGVDQEIPANEKEWTRYPDPSRNAASILSLSGSAMSLALDNYTLSCAR